MDFVGCLFFMSSLPGKLYPSTASYRPVNYSDVKNILVNVIAFCYVLASS